MKIHFRNKKSDFAVYMSAVASERQLPHIFKDNETLTIYGDDDRALELICEGTEVKLYFFNSFTNDAIYQCTEIDLADPGSIDLIMEWLDKIEARPE